MYLSDKIYIGGFITIIALISGWLFFITHDENQSISFIKKEISTFKVDTMELEKSEDLRGLNNTYNQLIVKYQNLKDDINDEEDKSNLKTDDFSKQKKSLKNVYENMNSSYRDSAIKILQDSKKSKIDTRDYNDLLNNLDKANVHSSVILNYGNKLKL